MVDVNYAKSIPLRLPYIDCTALRSIEPIELRYLTATSWPKPIVAAQHDVSHVPDLVLAQWQAAQYVSKQLQDKGILAIDASDAREELILPQGREIYVRVSAKGRQGKYTPKINGLMITFH